MHTYEKQYTDSSGKYEIIQVRTDGTRRKVEDNHAGLLNFLAGNVLPEVTYIAPPAPDPKEIARQELAGTDAGMIRVVEDLYDILLKKGALVESDVPQAVKDKIKARKDLRALL